MTQHRNKYMTQPRTPTWYNKGKPICQYTQEYIHTHKYIHDTPQEHIQNPTYIHGTTLWYILSTKQIYTQDTTQKYIHDTTQECIHDTTQTYIYYTKHRNICITQHRNTSGYKTEQDTWSNIGIHTWHNTEIYTWSNTGIPIWQIKEYIYDITYKRKWSQTGVVNRHSYHKATILFLMLPNVFMQTTPHITAKISIEKNYTYIPYWIYIFHNICHSIYTNH
jgi:hypothetical protein